MPYAHSANALGERHDLQAHLVAVAEQTAEFAARLGAGSELGFPAGAMAQGPKPSDSLPGLPTDAAAIG